MKLNDPPAGWSVSAVPATGFKVSMPVVLTVTSELVSARKTGALSVTRSAPKSNVPVPLADDAAPSR